MRGEFDWIRDLRRRVGAPRDGRDTVRVGIGDDCAVVSVPSDSELLLTTDLLVEGVHFVLDGLRPEDLGWKALAVSVSDVAAMGGRAAHAVVSVALRPEQTGAFADGLLGGLLACADRYGVSLVGGDTTGTPGPVVVNVALTGFAPRGRAVLRSGARPGDAICVTGALGGSILGRHLRVEPRQDEALALVQGNEVHAMIDVSDGLSSDLGHVVDLSEVGAEVYEDRIPIHDDAVALAARDGRPAIEHALTDGEDFELLFTLPAESADRLEREGIAGTRVTRVGRITRDRRYVLLPREGAAADSRPMERKGYDHFRRA
ncbi:MAG: thiamine-phosphate kinase [Planctomycetes bacterium]|nr:thiamine-phosphate kinase [Planctomycetota bacterium]